MQTTTNNIKKAVTILTLLVFALATVSVSYFCHIHTDQQGRIIVHSHPYDKHAGPSEADTGHSHTKQEFSFFALLYKILSLAAAVFSLSSIVLTILSRTSDPSAMPVLRFNLSGTISRRGPPRLTASF